MTSAAPLSRDELLELLEDLSHTLARSDERARMFASSVVLPCRWAKTRPEPHATSMLSLNRSRASIPP